VHCVPSQCWESGILLSDGKCAKAIIELASHRVNNEAVACQFVVFHVFLVGPNCVTRCGHFVLSFASSTALVGFRD